MLYSTLKWLFYLTVKGYFQSIQIKGLSNIPHSGPVVIVANHNSAFMDPILLAIHIKRPLYFLARGESFRSSWVSRIFKTLHMIPIYKPEVSPDEVHKNEAIFEHCYNHLSNNGALLIFPEGISKTERKLRPVKTGTARIVLGAEAANNFSLNTKIVPVGINYSNPHHFQSKAFIRIGTPLSVATYREPYEADAFEAVRTLTDQIKGGIEEQTLMVSDEQLTELVEAIEQLLLSNISSENDSDSVHTAFQMSKEIIEAVRYHHHNDPGTTMHFKARITQYLEALERLKLSDRFFSKTYMDFNLVKTLVYLLIGFPIFIYGFLLNVLPYVIVRWLARSIVVRHDFIGSMKLAFGMFVFLIYYLLLISSVAYFANGLWGAALALSMYPSGLFTINYLKRCIALKHVYRFTHLSRKKQKLVQKLRNTRQILIEELEVGRQNYVEAIKG